MLPYRERLWSSPWTFVSTALIIPAVLLVFIPISLVAGAVIAIVLYGGCVVTLVVSAPVVTVTVDELRAGRAHISRQLLGTAHVFTGDEAFIERGQRLDARAWLLLKGSIRSVVKVPLADANDPAPYWLISSRRPDALAAAINARE